MVTVSGKIFRTIREIDLAIEVMDDEKRTKIHRHNFVIADIKSDMILGKD